MIELYGMIPTPTIRALWALEEVAARYTYRVREGLFSQHAAE